MGKASKKDQKKNRKGPISGRPATININSAENEILRDQKILPIAKGITSTNVNDRTQYLSAFINIVQDETCRKLLLKERIVNTLLEQTLSDSTQEVVVLGWGALRSIAQYEGYDQAIYMYRRDIMTPAKIAIENVCEQSVEIKTTIHSLQSAPMSITKAQEKLLWGFTDNIVNLLASLCETTEEVTKVVGSAAIIEFLMYLLSPIISAPEKVQDSVAVCLHIITEENEDAISNLISEPAHLDLLLKLKEDISPESKVRTVAVCGILHHVLVEKQLQGQDRSSEEGQISHLDLLRTLTASLQMSISATPLTDESRLAIQLSLETIASIGTAIQDETNDEIPAPANISSDAMEIEEEDDGEVEADDDDDLPAEMEHDMEMVTGEEGTAAKVNGHIQSESDSIVTFLVDKAVPTIIPIAQSRADLLIQLRAVNALNNVAWTIAAVLENDPSSSLGHRQTWMQLVQQIWSTVVTTVLVSNTADLEVADALASLSWAIAKSVTGAVDLSHNQHRAFISLFNAATDAELKAKCVGVIGALGLAQGRIDINKEVGVFLITTVSSLPNTPNEAVIEALDAIYDVYADKDFDYDQPVFVDCGFLAHLKACAPKVKAMTKKIDQRKFPELRERADEAALNLAEFIKYKVKERK